MTVCRHIRFALPLLAAWLLCLLPGAVTASDVPLVTAEDLKRGFSIQGQWRFKPGDEIGWAQPGTADHNWAIYDLPASWPKEGFPSSNQMAWYRLSLQVAPDVLEDPEFRNGLGLRLGRVMSAYEVYVNGEFLGAVGQLPPLARGNYDREKVHFLPTGLVGPEGELDIALRVWGGSEVTVRHWGGGPYGGEFSLGGFRTQLFKGMSGGLPALVMCALYLGFGIYHLYLYNRNRQLKLFLWFGVLAINVSIYGLMLTQWKYMLPIDFDTMKKIEFGSVFLMPALCLQMVWALLGTSVKPWMRAYQMSFVVLSLVGIAEPWPDTQPMMLNWFQLWTLPVLFFGPLLVWRSMRAGHPEARTVFLGMMIFAATAVNDMLIDMARLESARMIHYGFVAIMLSMSVSLGNRFTTMLNRLEREVEERTEELSLANRQLAAAARIDPLTSLLNRRGFIEEAEKEIQRMFRGSPGFALVLADLDHFKAINDRYGHSCGDQVLRRVAAVLSYRIREVDQVARWGGEEFIFLLPETDADGAAVVAESLRNAVAAAGFDYDGLPMNFTMTFGIAAHRKGETLDATIHRADEALYHGKEAGRNKVMIGSCKGLTVVN